MKGDPLIHVHLAWAVALARGLCDPPDYELEVKEEDPDYQFEFDEYCEYVMERVTGD